MEPEQSEGPDNQFTPVMGAARALVRSGRGVPGPRDAGRVVPPLGRRPAGRGTQLKAGPGGDPNGDTAGQTEVLRDQGSLVVRVPGRAEESYPDLGFGRLSPSGSYVLAVEETEAWHGAVTVDIRTGELWRVPKDVYPRIAWSYGDIAMVDTDNGLLACDAARRACERLLAERQVPMPMPTN